MSKNIFEIIVELQHQFNKQVFEDYLKRGLNWNSAIIAESGELLDSLGYKWWKKQTPDMDNVKVEAIDLLHFVISEYVQNIGIDETIDRFNKYFTTDEIVKDTPLILLVDMLNYRDWERFEILKAMFEQLNMTNEDVYIAYIVKNCLNKFRQDNGYKDGSYIKDWNGKEDNVVAFELASNIGATENLFKELYNDLKKIYVCNVAFQKDKKTILDDIDYLIAIDATEI